MAEERKLVTIMFMSERGILLLRDVSAVLAQYPLVHSVEALHYCSQVAMVLASDDNARLAEAIEEEAADHGLVPHAARMRIVLAQRTGDRPHLDRARPDPRG